MSGTDHPSVDSVPSGSGEPGDRPSPVPDRARATRRWAVGVLALATVVLAAYLAMVMVAVLLVGSAMDALSGREMGALDVTGILIEAAPGLLVGWGVGLLAAAALGRGEALGTRIAGTAAGSLGVLVGAAVLAAAGIL